MCPVGELLLLLTVVAVIVLTIPEAKPRKYCAHHLSPSGGLHGLLCGEAPYADKGLAVFFFQQLCLGNSCVREATVLTILVTT